MTQPFDLVARSHSHRRDVLRCRNVPADDRLSPPIRPGPWRIVPSAPDSSLFRETVFASNAECEYSDAPASHPVVEYKQGSV